MHNLLAILPGANVDATSHEIQIIPLLLNTYTVLLQVLGHCWLQEFSSLFWSLTLVPCHLDLGIPGSTLGM